MFVRVNEEIPQNGPTYICPNLVIKRFSDQNWDLGLAIWTQYVCTLTQKLDVITVYLFVKNPHLPLQTEICVQYGPNYTQNYPTSTHFGGKHKFEKFYP